MAKKQYEFQYGIRNTEKWGKLLFTVLEDGTKVVIYKKGMTYFFPKKKFTEIFQKQIDDEKSDNIGIEFSDVEVRAIIKGTEMAEKELKEKKK